MKPWPNFLLFVMGELLYRNPKSIVRIFDLKFPTPYSLLPVPFAIDNQGRP
ncbi:MAG: hypothetical protein F6K50_13545 [Moorea sp. SIO3I7]|nr:hypothetical protein [Moorena sp. SIO3I7]